MGQGGGGGGGGGLIYIYIYIYIIFFYNIRNIYNLVSNNDNETSRTNYFRIGLYKADPDTLDKQAESKGPRFPHGSNKAR